MGTEHSSKSRLPSGWIDGDMEIHDFFPGWKLPENYIFSGPSAIFAIRHGWNNMQLPVFSPPFRNGLLFCSPSPSFPVWEYFNTTHHKKCYVQQYQIVLNYKWPTDELYPFAPSGGKVKERRLHMVALKQNHWTWISIWSFYLVQFCTTKDLKILLVPIVLFSF